MTCPTFEEIERSLDGAAPRPGTEAIEAHLAACPDCRARAEALELLDAQLAAALIEEDDRPRMPRARMPMLSRIVAAGEAEVQRRSSSGERRAAMPAIPTRHVPRRSRPERRVAAPAPPRAWRLPFGAVAAALFLTGGAVIMTPERPATPATSAAATPPGEDLRIAERWQSDAHSAPKTLPIAVFRQSDAPAIAPMESGVATEIAVAESGRGAPTAADDAAKPLAAPVAERGTRGVRLNTVRGDLLRDGTRVRATPVDLCPGEVIVAGEAGASIGFGTGVEVDLRAGAEALLVAAADRSGFVVVVERGEVLVTRAADARPSALRVKTRAGEIDVPAGKSAIAVAGTRPRIVQVR